MCVGGVYVCVCVLVTYHFSCKFGIFLGNTNKIVKLSLSFKSNIYKNFLTKCLDQADDSCTELEMYLANLSVRSKVMAPI
jgi:hypothetical protein